MKPKNKEAWTLRHYTALRLYAILSTVLQFKSFARGTLIWPLIVFSVAAADGNAEMRAFVKRSLPSSGQYEGPYVPLMANSILQIPTPS